MAVPQSITDALAALDTATNEVATYIAGLKGVISTSMTQADVDMVHNGIDAAVARLKALASDQGNPVPPLTPGALPKVKKP